jgi:hypothetical protein
MIRHYAVNSHLLQQRESKAYWRRTAFRAVNKFRAFANVATRACTAALLTGCLAGLLAAEATYAQGQLVQELETVKLQAYSKDFARRFALPEPKVKMEPTSGLQAIEFTVEKQKGQGFYWCVLKTYLDSSLPIAYPPGGNSGSRELVEQWEHFIFDNNVENKRWLALGVEDRRHFSAQNSFGRRAALASPNVDWPKSGYWAGLVYDAFYRELFSGVSYVKFGSPCGTYAAGKGHSPPQLWIERVGGKDYTQVVKPDPQDFLKLEMPAAFYEATIKWAVAADGYNRKLIERNRK